MREEHGSRLYVVVRAGARQGSLSRVVQWLRRLVPAAVLLVGPLSLPADLGAVVVTLDADEVVSGPLSLADALLRARAASTGDPAGP